MFDLCPIVYRINKRNCFALFGGDVKGRLRPYPSLREHGSPFPARRSTPLVPTRMIFTDLLENIAEPNHEHAQQNKCSPKRMKDTALVEFQGIAPKDDSTDKRFNFFQKYFLLSFS